MSNHVKTAESSSSDEEEEEESGSEEEEQPEVVKARVDAKVLERKQQAEEESSEEEEETEEEETDHNAEGCNTVLREGNSAGAARAAMSNNTVGKRGRGVEAKDEEPSKRSKVTNVEKVPAVVKSASPTRPTRGEPAGKGSKVAAAKSKPERTKMVKEVTEASAAGKKRKASSLPGSGTGKQQSQKVDADDKGSPHKTKTHFTWTANLEMAVSSALYHEKVKGKSITSMIRDPYWTKLAKDLNSGGDILTETQLCEKVRRMKNRYNQLKAKKVEIPWRNPHEEKLYRFWDGIWGSGKFAVRPESTQCVAEEDSEEKSSEDEDIANPAVANGSKVVSPPTCKEESSESEEDEDEEEPEAAPSKNGTRSEGSLKEVERSAFVPKPRLEYTPARSKDGKKGARKNDGTIAEQSGAELPREENDGDGQAVTAASNFVKILMEECFAVLREVRTSCLDAVGDIRRQSMAASDGVKEVHTLFGLNASTSGMRNMNESSVYSLDRGMMEELLIRATRSGLIGGEASLTEEMKRECRELGVKEVDLLEKRMQFTIKQLRLAKKKMQEDQDD